jgi:hypothetical protein
MAHHTTYATTSISERNHEECNDKAGCITMDAFPKDNIHPPRNLGSMVHGNVLLLETKTNRCARLPSVQRSLVLPSFLGGVTELSAEND